MPWLLLRPVLQRPSRAFPPAAWEALWGIRLSAPGLYSSSSAQKGEAQGRCMAEAPAWLYSGRETEIKEIAMVMLEGCVGSRSVRKIK